MRSELQTDVHWKVRRYICTSVHLDIYAQPQTGTGRYHQTSGKGSLRPIILPLTTLISGHISHNHAAAGHIYIRPAQNMNINLPAHLIKPSLL